MSVLKTAWANLQDGLGNRFSWSHVKAIFYNYAEQKLLSTKLDEMDALIDEKIAKAMMSNVQVNDQTKVPTSALAYAMQQQITENEEAITGLNSSDTVRKIPDASNLPDLTSLMEYAKDWNAPFMFGLDWSSSLSPDGSSSIGIMTRDGAWAFTHKGNIFYSNIVDPNPNKWKSFSK